MAVGVGMGTVLPVTTVAIQNAVELHQLGTATATMNFFRQLGGAFIVAIFGTIVLNGAGISGPIDGARHRRIVRQLVSAFRAVFLTAAGSVLGCLLFLMRMEEKPLQERRPDLLAETGAELTPQEE